MAYVSVSAIYLSGLMMEAWSICLLVRVKEVWPVCLLVSVKEAWPICQSVP